ncbi:DUF72 domain-containing protein [Flavobacterium sp. MC2016-06]|uniref:DUF72 domain-containing protein n=1 Tax=Flavobacterium sp. MC2016-06 TaxID=2676308 RepID=UPI0012BA983E|nr:DUF72 domain-containing protein [Flavobacterium sp. MC2016-06]MBU3860547.1 DUF72 domain-containing protein [Flavobacterium sp. MC2016-06]
MKDDILIGCSSYNNRYWKGVFYPENLASSKWFSHYCEHFNTYEMNGTFYKFPTIKVLDNWYKKVPENFLFSVKAPKEITHNKKFIDCKNLIDEFYDCCKTGLQEKLGCILFQFPPSYNFTTEGLQNIIDNLDLSFKNVIEFRHESWWNQEVWDSFLENNITFCSVSYPNLPNTIFYAFPLVYIRMHGEIKLFYSSYSSEELEVLKNMLDLSKQKAFVYFNNTASTAGILNALELKEILE